MGGNYNHIDLLLLSLIGVAYMKLKKPQKRYWVHPLWQQRARFGSYDNLVQELYKHPQKFKNYCRLTVTEYQELLVKITPLLKKHSIRKSLPPGLRLMLTLRFLATGNTMMSMSYEYRVGSSTVSGIIHEVCEAIWTALKIPHLKPPTEAEWLAIANQFYTKWNFPNCLGCIDGKHVVIQCPNKSGTLYYNYKKTFSVVLLAVCDANLRFIFVDIGAYGSNHDGSIFRQSAFGKKYFGNNLNFPNDQPFPKSKDGQKFPFFFIGDAAFQLHKHMLNPYGGMGLSVAQKIFNYRLARARNCVERAFGVLVARFNVLFSKIRASPNTVDSIIKATVVLHNFIINKRQDHLSAVGAERQCALILDKCSGLRRKKSTGLRFGARNSARENFNMRDKIKDYFMNDDILSWQMNSVNVGRI